MRVVLCRQCGRTCGDERLVLSRHSKRDGTTRLTFCSPECWYGFFEVVPEQESEEHFKKEANTLLKLVCPACLRRIRMMVE